MSSVLSITWGQSNPPIICVFWNTTGPKGGNQTRVSTNDITHSLGGKVILPSGTLQGSLHQNHIQGGLCHLYYTSWHIYTAEYAAKPLHVLFLWCKVFDKKIGIFFWKEQTLPHLNFLLRSVMIWKSVPMFNMGGRGYSLLCSRETTSRNDVECEHVI